MIHSRIAPDHQGPENVLARATRREQLLATDITIDPGENRAVRRVARAPELFRELGKTLLALTGE